jgi:hypothetical protein
VGWQSALRNETTMKRRIVGISVCAAFAASLAGSLAPASLADHYGRYGGYPGYRAGYYGGRGYYPGACGRCGGYHRGICYRGRRYYHHDDDDGGPSIGTLILGAGAAYGAYRAYEDYRDRERHRKDRDDDE